MVRIVLVPLVVVLVACWTPSVSYAFQSEYVCLQIHYAEMSRGDIGEVLNPAREFRMVSGYAKSVQRLVLSRPDTKTPAYAVDGVSTALELISSAPGVLVLQEPYLAMSTIQWTLFEDYGEKRVQSALLVRTNSETALKPGAFVEVFSCSGVEPVK